VIWCGVRCIASGKSWIYPDLPDVGGASHQQCPVISRFAWPWDVPPQRSASASAATTTTTAPASLWRGARGGGGGGKTLAAAARFANSANSGPRPKTLFSAGRVCQPSVFVSSQVGPSSTMSSGLGSDTFLFRHRAVKKSWRRSKGRPSLR
jgi:hypothetical protein